jgi:hypothetical protein
MADSLPPARRGAFLHAIDVVSEKAPLVARLGLKALPIIGFVPAAIETWKTGRDVFRGVRWTQSQGTLEAYRDPLYARGVEGILQGAQTALLVGSAACYDTGVHLAPHHPYASIPFFLAGASAQALALLIEPTQISEVVAARQTLAPLLREARRSSPAPTPTEHEPRIPFKE